MNHVCTSPVASLERCYPGLSGLLVVKLPLLLSALLCVDNISAEPDLWSQVKTSPSLRIEKVTLPQSRQESILKLLKVRAALDGWGCESDTDDWLENLIYETIPLSPRVKVFLVEAGTGCARGGQGSNGAMWLIRFDGSEPVLLASPQEAFNGWIHSVQAATRNGYRDIVVGWHMSAVEAGLTYFRFDGKSYGRVDFATLRTDDQDVTRIVPVK